MVLVILSELPGLADGKKSLIVEKHGKQRPDPPAPSEFQSIGAPVA
jgi:hypothetical protein